MFTLKPESIPGIDAARKIFKIIPNTINAKPRYKQFFALRGSSWRKIKNAIIPPMTPKILVTKTKHYFLVFLNMTWFFTIILQLLFFSVTV